MDIETRTAAARLESELEQQPYHYGFFQAMRRLECVYSDKTRFGQAQKPSLEPPIRLGQQVSLAFQPSTFSAFIRRKAIPPLFKQYFFGLFGTNGAMPLHLTEYIHERIHYHRDHTLTGFVDMFHHRMICLFYRAWANNEPTVSFDRPDSDKFSTYIGSLSGLGTDALRDRDAMPDLAKTYYTGFLASRSKHAEGLRALLADYFHLTVHIEQFVGEWLNIENGDLTKLGDSPRTGELGHSTILGSRIWACQHKFRVRFESLTLQQYISLLPNGYRLEQLTAIIRNYIGDELNWDAQLVLKKEQVPQAQLNGQFALGWTTWLGERQCDVDADDLRLNPFWGRL